MNARPSRAVVSPCAIRRDEDANYMALVLLGIYGQAMLNSLAGESFDRSQVRRLIRVVIEGIGEQS